MSYNDALEALKEEKYNVVIAWFKALPAADRDAKSCALAALAHFKLEKYAAAADLYGQAMTAKGVHDADWQRMKALADTNATAKINVEITKPWYFDRTTLLKPPQVRDGDLPRPLRHRRRHCFKRLLLFLGDALGAVLTMFMNWLIDWVGRNIGYRGRVWTNWYRHCWVIGVLILAYIRELLNAHNLISTYPHGALVGFQDPGQRPPLGVTDFRTADGSWNNLEDPKEGAAGTRFLRNVDLAVTCAETDQDRLLKPNPREISLKLLKRQTGPDGRPKMVPAEFLNLLAAAWIQFMTHDWVSHGDVATNKFIHVPLEDGDPARVRYQQDRLGIGATQADPTRNTRGAEPACTTSINEVTHWWDGSQIYGSDQATQHRLRSREMGKLRLRIDGTLPLTTDVEDTGFRRNWWIGLTMLHTLFVCEHNAICDMLHDAYPAWDDNRLFNVARLINAGLMAKIHSVEWTPAILPNQTLETGLNSNWYGLLTYLKRKAKERETVAEVNIRNPELGGIVGNPINKHHSPFGLSEEFVEVYRLHSLIPETLQIWTRDKKDVVEEVALPATRQHGSVRLTKRYAMSDLFYSFGNQHPGALVLNNFPRFMQELSVAGNVFLDMGTVDIVRARERGVPRYNEFRRQLGLTEIRSFDDLTDDAHVVTRLRSAYNDNVEDLDLLIGTLAENHRPTGYGFGETVFQIFIVSASRRLQADRFFTDDYNEDVYTPEGLRWIDQTDLKDVILRHHPELADTGLANIKNAFEPWDETPRLLPDRHPLRGWDRELEPDPWQGDAYRQPKHDREHGC
jgi:Animal haem peroxidase